jgi:hypothetical protein
VFQDGSLNPISPTSVAALAASTTSGKRTLRRISKLSRYSAPAQLGPPCPPERERGPRSLGRNHRAAPRAVSRSTEMNRTFPRSSCGDQQPMLTRPRQSAPGTRWRPTGPRSERFLRPITPTVDPVDLARARTGAQRFPVSNFTYCLTLSPECFSTFPHGTCSLSVSRGYLALDGIYHPLWAALPNNPTLRGRSTWRRIVLPGS